MKQIRPAQQWKNLPWPLFIAAAWLLPGLGHWLSGQRARGLIVGLTLMSLFGAGLVVGGVSVVDSKNAVLWYAGQVIIGPTAIIADHTHQSLKQKLEQRYEKFCRSTSQSPHNPDAREQFIRKGDLPYIASIGRVNELGTLYCTLAGVMNMLVILDLVGRLSQPSTGDSAADKVLDDQTRGRVVTRRAK